MLNPECLNKVNDIYSDGGMTILDISSLPYFDKVPYDLLDDKSFKKYMAELERTVRNSFEYRALISYLKNTEGMNKCSFLENVTSEDNNKIKIEIHHSPMTLFDICIAVYKKRCKNGESIDIASVAEEVMYLHYIGWVGLIPVSSTVHEMIHNNYLFVPTNKVRGNYREFVNRYYDFIEPDTLDTLDAIERATEEYNNNQMELFNNHKIYINANGSYALQRKDDISNMIRNRIDDIKSNKVLMFALVKK